MEILKVDGINMYVVVIYVSQIYVHCGRYEFLYMTLRDWIRPIQKENTLGCVLLIFTRICANVPISSGQVVITLFATVLCLKGKQINDAVHIHGFVINAAIGTLVSDVTLSTIY